MKKFVSLILAMGVAISALPGAAFAASGTFKDVPSTAWYADAVQQAYTQGLITGKTGNTFAPNSSLTIAETVVLASRIYAKKHGDTIETKYNTGKWYMPYVEYAADKHIIDNNWDSTAFFDTAITRYTFVGIMYNALPSDSYTQINTVDDYSIPDLRTDTLGSSYVYNFYRAGILTGSGSTRKLSPSGVVNRAEAAAIMLRMVTPSARVSFTLQKSDTANSSSSQTAMQQAALESYFSTSVSTFQKAVVSSTSAVGSSFARIQGRIYLKNGTSYQAAVLAVIQHDGSYIVLYPDVQ